MKKNTLYILLLLLAVGCSKDGSVESGSKVILKVDPLYQPSSAPTRAAISEWDNTPVALAYRIGAGSFYENYINATINTNADQNVNTGLEYPSDNTTVFIRGYYPVETLRSSGHIIYDISKANKDIMTSNEVSGSVSSPILATNKLNFKHKMSLIHFELICAPGATYPSRISWISIAGANTSVTLDLATDLMSFEAPGTLLVGEPGGFVVPQSGTSPIMLDAIVQPGVPLTMNVVAADAEIGVTPITAINNLISTGAVAGKKYTIKLEFTGTTIVAGGISVIDWDTKPNGTVGLGTMTIF